MHGKGNPPNHFFTAKTLMQIRDPQYVRIDLPLLFRGWYDRNWQIATIRVPGYVLGSDANAFRGNLNDIQFSIDFPKIFMRV
jgi:hypothetical protein